MVDTVASSLPRSATWWVRHLRSSARARGRCSGWFTDGPRVRFDGWVRDHGLGPSEMVLVSVILSYNLNRRGALPLKDYYKVHAIETVQLVISCNYKQFVI